MIKGKGLVVRGATAIVLVALAGCAVEPEPLQKAELNAIVAADHAALVVDQDPITTPLNIYDAMARVIAYNLDNRTRMLEEALANNQLDLAQYDMLPTLAAEAGFTSRDSANASTSRSIQTQTTSLVPSTSTDRDHTTADIRLSWNILDFGVSYFQAKQQADRYLIAQGNRRKLLQRLLQQSRTAFWRAAAAQKLKPDVERELADAKAALADVARADTEQLRPRLATLQLKRTLLEIIGQLEALDQQLSSSEIELKSLINVMPTASIQLAIPKDLAPLPPFAVKAEDLELTAMANSTDVSEAIYTLRVERAESRKALLRLLPGVEIFDSQNFDSNTFLAFHQWREAGARVTSNLMRLVSLPSTLALADARVNLAETRRLALGMAVISRLHMALWRYQDTVSQSERAAEIDEVERGISQATEAAEAAESGNAIERIRNQASALRARMRSYEAYASAQDALGAVIVSLGLDPVPDNYRKIPANELANLLQRQFENWESGRIPRFDEAPRTPENDRPLGDAIPSPANAAPVIPAQPVDAPVIPVPANE